MPGPLFFLIRRECPTRKLDRMENESIIQCPTPENSMDLPFSPDFDSDCGSMTEAQTTDSNITPLLPLSPLSQRPILLYCNRCNKEGLEIYSVEDIGDFRDYVAYFRSSCCGWFMQTQPPTEVTPGIPISDLRKGQYRQHASYSSPVSAEDVGKHYEKTSPYSTFANPDGWLTDTDTVLPDKREAKARTLDHFEEPELLPSTFTSVFDSPPEMPLFPSIPLRLTSQAASRHAPPSRTITRRPAPIYRHTLYHSIPLQSATQPPAKAGLEVFRPAQGRCFRWFMCGRCHSENVSFRKTMLCERTWLVYRTARCTGRCEVFEYFAGRGGEEPRLVKWEGTARR